MLSTAHALTDVEEDIVYPTRDGKPVAESALHFEEIVAVFQMLDDFFKSRPDVCVAANNFIYYEKGKPASCIAPDGYVVFGVPKGPPRDCFKVWEEGGHVPAAVFEITSRSSRLEDQGDKKLKCATMGVQEYFMYDPRAEYLKPPLQGYRLQHGFYTPILPDKRGRLQSKTLGLDIGLDENGRIYFVNRKTGKRLLRQNEVAEALENEKRDYRKAQKTLRRETSARQDAEAEIARLKAELERLKNP